MAATVARKAVKSGRPAVKRSEHSGGPTDDDVWINPGKRGEKLVVSEFPTYTLGRLTGIIKRSFMPAYVEPFGLSIPEWRVMAAIATRSSLSFNEICTVVTMDRAQVSRTLASLIAKGIAAQLTAARAERRGRGHGLTQTKVLLTAEGSRTYRRILPIAQRHQMILLSALDDEERSVARRVFRKMLAAAEEFEAAKLASRSKSRDVSAKRARSDGQRISQQGEANRSRASGSRYAEPRGSIDP